MKEMLIGAVGMYLIISLISFISYAKSNEYKYAAIPVLIPETIIGCFIVLIRGINEALCARHELKSIFSFPNWYEKWLSMYYDPDQTNKAEAFYSEDKAKEELINNYSLAALKELNNALKNEENKD